MPPWLPRLLDFLVAFDGPLCVIVLALVLYRSWTKEDSLGELLRLERASSLRQQNETMKILLQSFVRGGQPTLRDLVENIDDDWSLKP